MCPTTFHLFFSNRAFEDRINTVFSTCIHGCRALTLIEDSSRIFDETCSKLIVLPSTYFMSTSFLVYAGKSSLPFNYYPPKNAPGCRVHAPKLVPIVIQAAGIGSRKRPISGFQRMRKGIVGSFVNNFRLLMQKRAFFTCN